MKSTGVVIRYLMCYLITKTLNKRALPISPTIRAYVHIPGRDIRVKRCPPESEQVTKRKSGIVEGQRLG